MFFGKRENTIEELRKELKDECYGMAYAAGFPEALLEISDIDRADDEEIIRLAKKHGLL